MKIWEVNRHSLSKFQMIVKYRAIKQGLQRAEEEGQGRKKEHHSTEPNASLQPGAPLEAAWAPSRELGENCTWRHTESSHPVKNFLCKIGFQMIWFKSTFRSQKERNGGRIEGNYYMLSHYIVLLQRESQTLIPRYTRAKRVILRNQGCKTIVPCVTWLVDLILLTWFGLIKLVVSPLSNLKQQNRHKESHREKHFSD